MRRAILIALLATASGLVYASEEVAFDAFTNSVAKSALVGMQIGIRKGVAQGKVPASVGQCVNALPEQSFSEVVAAQLKARLNGDELKSAEAFFRSAVGQKYYRYGLIQLYTQMGESVSEPLPEFSDTEYKEIERFSKTSVGNKLTVQKVLESPAVRQAFSARIQQLLAQCRP